MAAPPTLLSTPLCPITLTSTPSTITTYLNLHPPTYIHSLRTAMHTYNQRISLTLTSPFPTRTTEGEGPNTVINMIEINKALRDIALRIGEMKIRHQMLNDALWLNKMGELGLDREVIALNYSTIESVLGWVHFAYGNAKKALEMYEEVKESRRGKTTIFLDLCMRSSLEDMMSDMQRHATMMEAAAWGNKDGK